MYLQVPEISLSTTSSKGEAFSDSVDVEEQPLTTTSKEARVRSLKKDLSMINRTND
jgi:hypothetical protein